VQFIKIKQLPTSYYNPPPFSTFKTPESNLWEVKDVEDGSCKWMSRMIDTSKLRKTVSNVSNLVSLSLLPVKCKGPGTGSKPLKTFWATMSTSCPVRLKTPCGTYGVIVIRLTGFHKPPFHPLPYICSCFSGFISYPLVKPLKEIAKITIELGAYTWKDKTTWLPPVPITAVTWPDYNSPIQRS
jgi:hypothetical protein